MKIVFSEGKLSFQKEYEGKALVGKKIGDEIEGGIIGLDGYKLKITGGSVKDGTPMHPSIAGQKRMKAVLGRGIGTRHLPRGKKVKKGIAGNMVSENVTQINAKITAKGTKTLAEMGLTLKPKEAKAEKKEEAKPAGKKKK
ncbi:MAG TPA: S6e family ribosomal protein [Candidatus Norongarragalinales archaeon]|nr:S6e family ribosomal protein [Candidatus Norongarragalinales archaeon]